MVLRLGRDAASRRVAEASYAILQTSLWLGLQSIDPIHAMRKIPLKLVMRICSSNVQSSMLELVRISTFMLSSTGITNHHSTTRVILLPTEELASPLRSSKAHRPASRGCAL